MSQESYRQLDNSPLHKNFCRLTVLLVDTATELLRELFLHILGQAPNTFFNQDGVRCIIEQLAIKGVIHLTEKKDLLSTNVDVEKFDLSLLYTLLTTFCSSITRPRTGWKEKPRANDHSIGADLVRLRHVRNNILFHRGNARLSNEEFTQIWEEVKGVILRIARTELPHRMQHFSENIDYVHAVVYVFVDRLDMPSDSASLWHLFAKIPEKHQKQKTEDMDYVRLLLETIIRPNKDKWMSPACLFGAKDKPQEESTSYLPSWQRLGKWSKPESKYTEEPWLTKLKINPNLKKRKGNYVCVFHPSDTEGTPQNDSSDESPSVQLILSLEQRLEILEKWQKQENAYTEDTREFILKSSLILDKPEMVSSVGQSRAEGSQQNSPGPLTLTPEKRLQILQKWKDQETKYTEETRDFILKSGFSRKKPEKGYSSCPSDSEDSDTDTDSALFQQLEQAWYRCDVCNILMLTENKQSHFESIPHLAKAAAMKDPVELSKLRKNDADKEIVRLLIEALHVSKGCGRSIIGTHALAAKKNVTSSVFTILHKNKEIGTAFVFKSLGDPLLLTAGHVIDGIDKNLELKTEGLSYFPTSPVGISSIADVGVLRPIGELFREFSFVRPFSIDLGTETCTHIYVVGFMSGNRNPQIEECLVLPSRDDDDGIIRFQSKIFSEGSFGSPCLVFKDGQYVVKGMLVGREERTDTPYELIAITFRCVWKRLELP